MLSYGPAWRHKTAMSYVFASSRIQERIKEGGQLDGNSTAGLRA